MRRYWGQQKPPLGVPANKGHILCPSSGLWLMNEGHGSPIVQDLSGNGNTGTLTGTSPSWIAGDLGAAIDLPGTNEDIVLANTINLTYPWTIILKYWPDTNSSVFFGDNTTTTSFFRHNANATILTLRNAAGTDRNITGFTDVTTQWNTLAIVTTATDRVAGYQNGKFINLNEITWDVGFNVNCIGHGYTGASIQYNGKIGYCSIYNRAYQQAK